jgi:hypothetical protein
MVNLLFDSFKETIGELPVVYRSQIFRLLRFEKYQYLERVLHSPNMHLICSGNAVSIDSKLQYRFFQEKEEQINKHQSFIKSVRQQPLYSAKAKIGFCVLAWLL